MVSGAEMMFVIAQTDVFSVSDSRVRIFANLKLGRTEMFLVMM